MVLSARRGFTDAAAALTAGLPISRVEVIEDTGDRRSGKRRGRETRARAPNANQFGRKVAGRREQPGVFPEVLSPSTGRLAPFRYELSGIGRAPLALLGGFDVSAFQASAGSELPIPGGSHHRQVPMSPVRAGDGSAVCVGEGSPARPSSATVENNWQLTFRRAMTAVAAKHLA